MVWIDLAGVVCELLMGICQVLSLLRSLGTHLRHHVLDALDNASLELSAFVLKRQQGLVMSILLLYLTVQS